MRSRIATTITALALIAGTGGAIALGESGAHGGPLGGAASGQYCNGKKCPPPPKHNCGKHHNQKCPPPPKHNCGKHHNQTCPTKKPKPKHKAKPKPKHKKSYHCVSQRVGRNLVTNCRYY